MTVNCRSDSFSSDLQNLVTIAIDLQRKNKQLNCAQLCNFSLQTRVMSTQEGTTFVIMKSYKFSTFFVLVFWWGPTEEKIHRINMVTYSRIYEEMIFKNNPHYSIHLLILFSHRHVRSSRLGSTLRRTGKYDYVNCFIYCGHWRSCCWSQMNP